MINQDLHNVEETQQSIQVVFGFFHFPGQFCSHKSCNRKKCDFVDSVLTSPESNKICEKCAWLLVQKVPSM